MRSSVWLFIFLFGAACAKHAAPPPAPAAAPEPTARQLAALSVSKFDIHPTAVRRDQPVSVTVDLDKALPGTEVTLAWFGPDGWLLHDDEKELRGNTVSFVVPAGTFPSPGRYHADVRADVVYLAGGDVTVTE
jgi:hypothetical protein